MVFLLYAMLTVDHSVTTRVMDSHMSRWTRAGLQLINYHSVVRCQDGLIVLFIISS